jgi:hypothetical protein
MSARKRPRSYADLAGRARAPRETTPREITAAMALDNYIAAGATLRDYVSAKLAAADPHLVHLIEGHERAEGLVRVMRTTS